MSRQTNELVVGLVQMRPTPDLAENLSKAMVETRKAAKAGAQIVCLPELFHSPYFCQTEDYDQFNLAESLSGPSVTAFCQVAKECRVNVIVPLFERRAPGLYHNSVAILAPHGEVQGIYRKMHIPDDPAYYEKFYFTPGDLGFKAWECKDPNHANTVPNRKKTPGKNKSSKFTIPQAQNTPPAHQFGVLICWDQWFPEAARLTALAGAEILFYPTAIGWHPHEKAELGKTQHEAWQTIQRAHAIANGTFVCTVNRVGHELPPMDFSGGEGAGIEFWGQSFVADPMGRILAQAAPDREETLLVPLNMGQVEYARTHWPFLRDRRVEAYSGLTKKYGEECRI